jgi:ABC-type uncharacterized transport system involved in gliding motility auxiliary subunit
MSGAMQRRRFLDRTTLGTALLLLAALLAMVNYLAARYSKRFDWTSAKLYSLSEKSRGVLAGLDRDVEVTVFMRPSEALYEPVRELLRGYETASPRLRVRAVDPERNLLEAQRLVDKGVRSLNVVVFDTGQDRRVVESADLAEYDYSDVQFGGEPRLTNLRAEERFTGALLELVESRKPTILLTSGHGEAALDDVTSGRGLDQARELLGRDNFQIESWPSLGKVNVPEGTDLLIVAGPTLPFAKPELDVFGSYLAAGGRMLVLLDPPVGQAGRTPDPGLVEWLAAYAVRVGTDVVLDPSNPLPFFGAETLFTGNYGDHPTTQTVAGERAPVVLQLARSVSKGPVTAGYSVTELIRTSPEGWAETDLANLTRVEKDARDVAGPVALAVAVTAAKAPAGETDPVNEDDPAALEPGDAAAQATAQTAQEDGFRLVVYGDADWIRDTGLRQAANALLLADTVNWLAARPRLIGIPSRTPEQTRLRLDRTQMITVWAIVLGLMPLAALVAGVGVHLRRRR